MAKTEKEIIRAVYHKDVANFFELMGLYEKLIQGELHCSICGQQITLDNFRAAARKANELLFCCDRELCILKFDSYLKGDRT